VEALDAADGKGRRDIAAGVAAHAVRDDEQVRSGVPGILVVGADLPGMGDRGARALEDHLVRCPYARSSKVVAPTLMGVPICTCTGLSLRRCPFRNVPLVDPRSCSIQMSPRCERRAWWLDV